MRSGFPQCGWYCILISSARRSSWISGSKPSGEGLGSMPQIQIINNKNCPGPTQRYSPSVYGGSCSANSYSCGGADYTSRWVFSYICVSKKILTENLMMRLPRWTRLVRGWQERVECICKVNIAFSNNPLKVWVFDGMIRTRSYVGINQGLKGLVPKASCCPGLSLGFEAGPRCLVFPKAHLADLCTAVRTLHLFYMFSCAWTVLGRCHETRWGSGKERGGYLWSFRRLSQLDKHLVIAEPQRERVTGITSAEPNFDLGWTITMSVLMIVRHLVIGSAADCDPNAL